MAEEEHTEKEKPLEAIAQESKTAPEKPKPNYLAQIIEAGKGVYNTGKSLYGTVAGLKQTIDEKLKVRREIQAAEKYCEADLKREEAYSARKLEDITGLKPSIEKKIIGYEQILAAKQKDHERMSQESSAEMKLGRKVSLRDKLFAREKEIAITESVIANYKTILSKLN